MIGKTCLLTMTAALVLAAGSWPVLAQAPAEEPAEAPATKRKFDPSRRVPAHFAQVGLTAEQRESIYKIRRARQEKVDALRKQIAESEAQSMGECEAVLTEAQKKLLAHLRATGGRAAAKPAITETAKATK